MSGAAAAQPTPGGAAPAAAASRPAGLALRLGGDGRPGGGGGRLFGDVVAAEVRRDLEELAGTFRVEVLDRARTAAALPGWWKPAAAGAGADGRGPLAPGERVEVLIDGETVLLGWIDAVEVRHGADELAFSVSGRDATGDLVDCAPFPRGPAELLGLTLPEIVARLCAPFGIAVRCEIPPGPPFPRFGLAPGETALSAVEKACRQRAALATSDGVGGLVITRGGRGAGPAPLVFGGNILSCLARFDHSQRHSDYLVIGQSERPARPGAGPAMSVATSAELDPSALEARRPAPTAPGGERPRVVMTGEARDPAVRRFRPAVRLSKTQSGGASVQEQADWMMRTARGRSESLEVEVAGWRAGAGPGAGPGPGRLWRPNERVAVDDPLAGASAELLVAAVTYRLGPEGARTALRLCGPEAFDVLAEGGDERARQRPAPPARPATVRASGDIERLVTP